MTYLDLIRDADHKIDNGDITLGEYEKMIEPLKREIQPERKTGYWNTIQGDIVVCSACGMGAPQTMTGSLVNRHLEPNRTNFCPHCGADMRGAES